MKAILTILGILLFSVSSFAFAEPARLTVSASDNSFLRIVIDGRYDKQGSSILIDEMSTGYHDIKIYQARKGWGNNRNNNFDLIYSNGVLFRPMHHVDIVIGRFGKIVIDERQISRYDNRNNNDRSDWGRGYEADDRRYNNRRNGSDNRYFIPMSNEMFRSAKQAIGRQGFDDSRLDLARQIIHSNYLSTVQVKELMLLFSFESNKLELAKQAYPRTIDRNNFFIVNEAFSFRQTKEALTEYIRNYR